MRLRWTGTATLLLASTTWGQVPADLVPADAVVMAGWRGTLDPGPGYAGSNTEAALKDSQFTRLIDETLPAIGLALEHKDATNGPIAHAAVSAVRQLLRHPSAVFVAAAADHPEGGLVCRAGADAKSLTDALQQVAAQLPPQAAARVVSDGDHVTLLLGYAADAAVPAGGLDQTPLYQHGVAACVAEPSWVVHVDVDRARAIAEQHLNTDAPPEVGQKVLRFLDASGLDGVHAYTGAAGFEDKLWRTDDFVDAPTPRKGLIGAEAPQPIDAALLQRVPASANSVTAFDFDAVKALAAGRGLAAAVDPSYGDMVDKVVGGATMAIGKNVQTDLLAALGPQWAAYTSPLVGGTSMTGVVVVNKLVDPLKAKQAMAASSIFLSNMSHSFMPNKDITVAGRMTRVGDLSVYYIATPLLSPAWTIKDGYLYLGLYPQSVIAAAREGGESIAENADFAEAMKLSGDGVPQAITYTDVKATLPDGYQTLLAGSRTLFGLSDLFLASTPEPLVPTLSALHKQATPVVSASWADAAGLHQRSRSPFPGANTLAHLSLSDAYLTNLPLMTSILLPSLNRAREAANRVKSASNLRQIGLGCKMYANEQKGLTYPQDFNELLHKEELTADVFVNPRTSTQKPPLPPNTDAADFYGQWANTDSDYVYVGAGKNDSEAADHIIAYEKPAGLDDGINVLFADGHVEFVDFAEMEKVFKAGAADVPNR